MKLTLVREVGKLPHYDVGGFVVRGLEADDAGKIAELYQEAYGAEVAGSLNDAVEEINSSLAGEYGSILPEASLVALVDGNIVGCVLTVDSPTWEDVAGLVFIIDIFVDSAYRQRGIAQSLLAKAISNSPSGREIGLRVESENHSAVSLYRKLGFAEARV